jgi:hypothetical protein
VALEELSSLTLRSWPEETDGAREEPACWASWRSRSTEDWCRGNTRPSDEPELSRWRLVSIGERAGFVAGVLSPESGGDDSEDEVPDGAPRMGGE